MHIFCSLIKMTSWNKEFPCCSFFQLTNIDKIFNSLNNKCPEAVLKISKGQYFDSIKSWEYFRENTHLISQIKEIH